MYYVMGHIKREDWNIKFEGIDSYVVVQINESIGLNLNISWKFRLPETFSRYHPCPQPILQALM